jgi:hypothetical protein
LLLVVRGNGSARVPAVCRDPSAEPDEPSRDVSSWLSR